ncbi:MAG: hypothetical protein EA397_13915 [Deltaproteobacteria bacterium]|nr:MAG: hypothetical protein EA397_13915 [Deltaproteobacteria bacterium]
MTLLLTLAATATPPQGTYLKATPEAQAKAEIERAVDEAAKGVAWAFRGMARPRLAKHATACERYIFEPAGDEFRVQCDGRDPFEWPLGKRDTFTDERGNQVTAEVTEDDGAYTVVIEGDQGGKRWLYRFGDDGGLRVTQEIFSPHMSQPMRWTLDYQRS